MYWPLGAPSVYEQSLFGPIHDIPHDGEESVAAKGDDLISGPPEGLELSTGSESQEVKIARAGDASEESAATGSQSSSRAQGNELSQHAGRYVAAQPSDRGAIVSVASSRNGNTFATITNQALAIWSSRVKSSFHLL